MKLIVPLLVKLVRVTSPVKFQVAPSSTVTTALSATDLPPSALSTILMVPVKLVPLPKVRFKVEMVSTSMAPYKV